MARAKSETAARRSKPINATDQHRAWLELVDTEGPFLAIPPLKRVWPQGMPGLTDERKAALVDARKDFEGAWETLDRAPNSETAQASYRVARDKWVETILRDVAGWAESLSWGEVPGVEAQSPNRAVTIRAQASLNGADGIDATDVLLVLLFRRPGTCGLPTPSTASKSCCARTRSPSASSPTAAGGVLSVAAKVQWPRLASSTH